MTPFRKGYKGYQGPMTVSKRWRGRDYLNAGLLAANIIVIVAIVITY